MKVENKGIRSMQSQPNNKAKQHSTHVHVNIRNCIIMKHVQSMKVYIHVHV